MGADPKATAGTERRDRAGAERWSPVERAPTLREPAAEPDRSRRPQLAAGRRRFRRTARLAGQDYELLDRRATGRIRFVPHPMGDLEIFAAPPAPGSSGRGRYPPAAASAVKGAIEQWPTRKFQDWTNGIKDDHGERHAVAAQLNELLIVIAAAAKSPADQRAAARLATEHWPGTWVIGNCPDLPMVSMKTSSSASGGVHQPLPLAIGRDGGVERRLIAPRQYAGWFRTAPPCRRPRGRRDHPRISSGPCRRWC